MSDFNYFNHHYKFCLCSCFFDPNTCFLFLESQDVFFKTKEKIYF
jgi:hypothetical protein